MLANSGPTALGRQWRVFEADIKGYLNRKTNRQTRPDVARGSLLNE
jgi:hypothetical protein